MSLLKPIRNFYGRFEKLISSISLISGFVFDAITLKRVDTPLENIWILVHLFIISIFIILIQVQENEEGDEKNPSKAHFWYVNILQFFFGGILSTYLVFYFRSTDFLATWPFIFLLIMAFIANQSFKHHYIRFSFQISLFFLSVYSFAIFIVPVLLHEISARVFLISGILSLFFIFIFIAVLFLLVKNRSIKDKYESKLMISFMILGIFVIVNALYFTNLIPPIPLSLKEAGVYHSVQKNSDGKYDVTSEDHGTNEFFKLFPDFTEIPNSPIYAFSAIFSPRGLNLNIVHEWQEYNTTSKKWVTNGVIKLSVVGGRDGGFRTYSMRTNLAPGKWRVNVETEEGKLIGRLRFNIVNSPDQPILSFKEQ